MALVEKLNDIARPLVEEAGLSLWGLQYQTGAQTGLLRVYIDGPDGVNVDQCAAISRQLSVLLDAEDIIRSAYRLEVSSPGMARPFFTLEQYQGFEGHVVKVKLRYAYEGRKRIKGIVSSIDTRQRELGIVDGDTEYLLPFEAVESGQLVPQFEK
ncbi:MAG: ribosome maturation factor RimP [Gammaproteobacteria bacterium]|nr:ribosome maturation factor RimP [Gammaproteobacteria bacterium]NND38450.1 ribosome maturation factor RimP [Pseudomonadales bacterium]MBT8149934.1 ribosome maturation factor RimP [Gammaproteobacteria bacterium]NNL10470.1 ribosome maturation factor RimP [Pseudomonadales bacterium]NNM11065.1 ribosome maturation factor RimP [Pseudomonadales bacterium]